MTKKMATRQAFGEALAELGAVNPNVVALDADLYRSTMSLLFAQKFPERFFDLGIAEQDMVSTGAGLAAAGKIPFVSTFAVFAAGRACDQIRQQVALPRLSVKICGSSAGITQGPDGATHQSVADVAIMRALPNMTVVVPADEMETKKAVFAAADFDGPVYLRLGRWDVPAIFADDYDFHIGKAVVMREGTDVSICANGTLLHIVLEAAGKLANEGISAQVVNVHTVKPLDEQTILTCAAETGAVVTAEEHSVIGGLGGAIAELLSEKAPTPLKRVGIQDVFGQSGTADELMEKYGLTVGGVISAVHEVLRLKQGHQTERAKP